MGASPYHCQFVDEELCIVIRTAEGARDDTRSRRQCVRQLSSMLCYSDAPTESRIRFEMLKEKQGPVIKLYVSREVLPQLPLLADIGSCTQTDPDSVNTTEGVSRDGNVTPACSAWGLVSLVLLMEGEVEVEEWFGSPDGDPALPAATLEVRLIKPAAAFNLHTDALASKEGIAACLILHLMCQWQSCM